MNSMRAFPAAEAASVGLSRYRVDGIGFRRPFRGIRASSTASAREILLVLLSRLPAGAFLMAETAARYWKIPLPAHLYRSAFCRPQVGVDDGTTRIRRSGVDGRSIKIEPGDVVVLGAVAVTSLPRTWLDLSAKLQLEDLVAFTDAVLRQGWYPVGKADLLRVCERFPKAKGVKNRRLALDLADPGAESWMESIVRVRLVLGGLPRPRCNPELQLSNGRLVRPDMFWPELNLILEYNGGYHHTPEQARRDESRNSQLRSDGYRVLVLNKSDIWPQEKLVARFRHEIDAAGGA